MAGRSCSTFTVLLAILFGAGALTDVRPARANDAERLILGIGQILLNEATRDTRRTRTRRAVKPRSTRSRQAAPRRARSTRASKPADPYIREVQLLLNRAGHPAGNPDGRIGPRTSAAIRSFQSRLGHRPTGTLSPGEFASLQRTARSGTARSGTARPDRRTGPQIVPRRAEPVRPAVSPERARWIQTRLAEIGYDPGPADGRPGPRTRSAISEFQVSMGHAATGHLTDPQVQYLREVVQHRRQQAGAAERGRWLEIERLLATLRFPVGLVDGVADPTTLASLNAFQTANDMVAQDRLSDTGLLQLREASRLSAMGGEDAMPELPPMPELADVTGGIGDDPFGGLPALELGSDAGFGDEIDPASLPELGSFADVGSEPSPPIGEGDGGDLAAR